MNDKDILLLWDVDGTLLENPSAGHSHQNEFLSAVSAVMGRSEEPDQIDGSTDYAIIHSIFKNSGFSKEEANKNFALALAELEKITTSPNLIQKSRVPIKGAKDCLQTLAQSCVQTYATGNSPARAQSKLAQFAMDHFLDLEIGGFGWWTDRRADFVRRAISLAENKYQKEFIPAVIGDTPFDIASAHEVGALSVAVAGGIFSKDDLKGSKPHLVLDDLTGSELSDFLLALGDLS
jgi:phosphoglycolate phosphatase-like HAD superfamily hydrolase